MCVPGEERTADHEVQVMETRKMVLGPEHLETLTSMTNLAFTFWRWKGYSLQLMFTDILIGIANCSISDSTKE
jgi:hypothetical protein